MLEVFDYELASCPTKVRLALAEKGIAWNRRRTDILKFEHKRSRYISINPAGLLPTIILDSGDSLTESHIIIQYLDTSDGKPSLTPEDPLARAKMQLWLKRIDDIHLAQGLWNYDQVFLPYWRTIPADEMESLLRGFESAAAAERMRFLFKNGVPKERLVEARQSLVRFFNDVEIQLERTLWLCGDNYTLADTALTPYVNSVVHAVSDIWNDKLANVRRWLRQVRERPSYHSAIASYPLEPKLIDAILAAPEGGGWPEI